MPTKKAPASRKPAHKNGKMKLSDFRPQESNANLHTPHGLRELRDSIQRDGIIGAITVAADGEAFDGSARLETLAEAMPGVAFQVVDTVGDVQLVNRRIDIPNAKHPRAKRLSVAANAIAHIDYNPDGALLAALSADDAVLKALISQDDASRLAVTMIAGANAGEWAQGFEKVPGEDRAPFQQMTFTLHDTQAEQVKAAVKAAQAVGLFVAAPNENSNGNALARICETYLTYVG